MNVTQIPITDPHLDQFYEHLLRLSPEDQQLRFGGVVSDWYVKGYVACMYPDHDYLIVSYDDDTVIGAAHVNITDGLGDLGLSVEYGYRGQGRGSALLDAAINLAIEKGAEVFQTQCASHNNWMTRAVNARGFTMLLEDETRYATKKLHIRRNLV